jgi:hypothetical protein
MSAANVRSAPVSATRATTAAFGEGRLGLGVQQHDRNDDRQNAASASHKGVPPMANEPNTTFYGDILFP